jgi:hypothetical protein
MARSDEKKAPAPGEIGEGKTGVDEPRGHDGGDDPDRRKADSDFDDLNIEVDESELEAELRDPPPTRKY